MKRLRTFAIFALAAGLTAAAALAQPAPQSVTVTILRPPGAPEPEYPEWILWAMEAGSAYGGTFRVTTVAPDAALTRCAARSDGDRRMACIRSLPRDAVTILVHRGAASSMVVQCLGTGAREANTQAQVVDLRYLSWGPGRGAADTGGFRDNRREMAACLTAAHQEPAT